MIPDTAVSTFKGEVVVEADSDLKGKTIAALSANSASGYIYPVVELKDLVINPTKVCTLITVNDIPSELTAVLNGQAMLPLYLKVLDMYLHLNLKILISSKI